MSSTSSRREYPSPDRREAYLSDRVRHDRSRSRERDSKSKRRNSPSKERKRDRSRGRREQSPDRYKSSESKDIRISIDEVQAKVSRKVKELVDMEVQAYVGSEEFKRMVETLKRNERERVMKEVQDELKIEKEKLIQAEREKMSFELAMMMSGDSDTITSSSFSDSADMILLQNKLKMELQQRKAYEAKVKEDADRLQEILNKKRQEEEQESERQQQLQQEQDLLEKSFSDSKDKVVEVVR